MTTSVSGIAVQAMDGIGIIGTIGFFVPAGIIVALVAGAVIRDRRDRTEDDVDPAA